MKKPRSENCELKKSVHKKIKKQFLMTIDIFIFSSTKKMVQYSLCKVSKLLHLKYL